MVGYYQHAAGQLLPAGFISEPLGIFPKRVSQLYVCRFRSADFLQLGPRSCLQTCFSVLVWCVQLVCVLACSSCIHSCWLLAHTFRPVTVSRIASFMFELLLWQHLWANVPPVRLDCVLVRIIVAPCSKLLCDVVLQVPLSWCYYVTCWKCPFGLSLWISCRLIWPCNLKFPSCWYHCCRPAGISWLLIKFSRPVSSRWRSIDIQQDHISLWRMYFRSTTDTLHIFRSCFALASCQNISTYSSCIASCRYT